MAHYGNLSSHSATPHFLEIGDATHPPGLLRLLVALTYLDRVFPVMTANSDPRAKDFDPAIARNQIISCYKTLKDPHGGIKTPAKWPQVADQIVDFFQTLADQNPAMALKLDPAVFPNELAAVQAVAAASKHGLEGGLRIASLDGPGSSQMYEVAEQVVLSLPEPSIGLPFTQLLKKSDSQHRCRQIESIMGSQRGLLKRIAGCVRIEDLLTLTFAEVDAANSSTRPWRVHPAFLSAGVSSRTQTKQQFSF